MLNLLTDARITRVENAAAAATTDVTTDVLDMKGHDGATFIALLGDVDDTSALELVVQQGDESDGSDATDTTVSATFTAGASNADNAVLAVEILRPSKRYVRAKLVRGTANAVVDGIVAIQTDPARTPATQSAGVIASAIGLTP